jgi:hypothetical protein
LHSFVHELQLALAPIKQVFLKRDVFKLEQVVDTYLHQLQKLETQHAPYFDVILNTKPAELGAIDLIILKQVLITKKLTQKLGYLPDSEVTIIKASLYILYQLLPDLVPLLKQQIGLKEFAARTQKVLINTFQLIFKLKINDKECLKLLSLLANKNKYSKTNLLAQATVLLSINATLLTNVKTASNSLSLEQALSSLLSLQPKWLLPVHYLSSVLIEFLTISSSQFFTGNLIQTQDKRYFLMFTQTEQISTWLCIEFEPLSKKFINTIEEIETSEIVAFYPQSRVKFSNLIEALAATNDQWQPYIETQSNVVFNTQTLTYTVPDFWPKIVESLISGNVKQLSANIDAEIKLKNILLQYASTINREKNAIRSSKHAISLVGQERVFPIITNGLFSAVQQSYRFIGSDAINEKVSVLTGIAYLVAKDKNTITLPEYLPMFLRLLAVSLFSVPKVRFSATSNNKPVLDSLFSHSHHICLAEVYQYNNQKLWLSICKNLISSWRLPRYVDQFMTKYLLSLTKPTHSNFSQKEREWINGIELTVACYIMLENGNLSNEMKKRLAITAKRFGMSLKSLKDLSEEYAQQLGYHTVLI